MKTVDLSELNIKLLQNYKIIDVRAPVEFAQGALPNSVNLPILDDEERALVGTCYKNKGKEKAIELGHQIVSGANKEAKLLKWKKFVAGNPDTIMTCFRGGLRSQLSQQFLSEAGVNIPRIEKGYKEVRQFFIDEINNYSATEKFRLLTGSTGSGKTKILKEVSRFYPVVDLEELAQHRGSAFGTLKNPQPAQASFENNLCFQILKTREKYKNTELLFEDESRLIGRVHLPELFFEKLRNMSVLKVNVTLENRIENIFSDYIYPEIEIFDKYAGAVQKISKKLGSEKANELIRDIQHSRLQFSESGVLDSNRVWIEKLLVWYYDPMYSYSLQNRNPQIEFEGSTVEIIDYLKNKIK